MAATSSTRRLTLVVVGSKPATPDLAANGPDEQEVEAIDLARLRGYRPVASGRTPLAAPGRGAWSVPEAALVEATRRDRLRGWITRSRVRRRRTSPPPMRSGLAWSALGLKVAHPGRPHRLTLTVNGGHPAALGVALVESPGQGRGAGPASCSTPAPAGPPILDGRPGRHVLLAGLARRRPIRSW